MAVDVCVPGSTVHDGIVLHQPDSDARFDPAHARQGNLVAK